jgi:single-strand DNA-binding protein
MLNRATLIGRLTKDPELRYSNASVPVTTFTLAVDRQFKNAQGEHETDFIGIVCWRQTAEYVSNYIGKGRLVSVEGRIQSRNYTNNAGMRIFVTEVVADHIDALEPRREDAQQGHTGGGMFTGYNSSPAPVAPSTGQRTAKAAPKASTGTQGGAVATQQQFPGADLKGHAKTQAKTWEAAGYSGTPQDISDDDLPF